MWLINLTNSLNLWWFTQAGLLILFSQHSVKAGWVDPSQWQCSHCSFKDSFMIRTWILSSHRFWSANSKEILYPFGSTIIYCRIPADAEAKAERLVTVKFCQIFPLAGMWPFNVSVNLFTIGKPTRDWHPWSVITTLPCRGQEMDFKGWIDIGLGTTYKT